MLRTSADAFDSPRLTLTQSPALATAIRGLEPVAESRADLWRMIVETFTVDLDALATILPLDEPEPVWLAPRG